VRASTTYLKDAEQADATWEALKKTLALPSNPGRLWDWCIEQSQERLLSLLAYAAGRSIDCIRKLHDDRASHYAHDDQLGRALGFDMTTRFTPTAANYFGRINRAAIEDAVRGARGEEAAAEVKAATKKAEAAAIAERLVAGSGWLPAQMRFAEPAAITNDEFTDDASEDADTALSEGAD
jgi:ParB family chromosome partitioning protein